MGKKDLLRVLGSKFGIKIGTSNQSAEPPNNKIQATGRGAAALDAESSLARA